MSTTFIDTSALFALLVKSDRNHAVAARIFDSLSKKQTSLVTSSYVLVESIALLQRRIGLPAVNALRQHIMPLLNVVWVDLTLHEAALDKLSGTKRKNLSLVDCVSFEVMTQAEILTAFAFDRHFAEFGGFKLLA